MLYGSIVQMLSFVWLETISVFILSPKSNITIILDAKSIRNDKINLYLPLSSALA